MDHKSDRGYNWSIVAVVIGVLLTIGYMIPQVIHEHQIEEDRLQRLERTISKQQEDIDALENKLISIMEDLNGNQISPQTNTSK
nr:MAG TPA: Lipopolysaccharide assembly protein A domain [Caudoviricetes sp.]